jgi:hypothetical protein
MIRSLMNALVAVMLLSAVESSSYAQFLPGGGVDTTDPELPPPGVYISPNAVHSMYSGPNLQIVFSDVQHVPFKDLPPAHIASSEHHDFDYDLIGQGQCLGVGCAANGVPPSFPIFMNGRVQTVAFNKGPSDTTGTFQTEMVGMSLQGAGPMPPFVMLRDSPTLPSLGLTRITDTGGGTFHIDSFFDVFTELSLDGGSSWMPSIGPTRIDLVPEPSSFVLFGLALLGIDARRRCWR